MIVKVSVAAAGLMALLAGAVHAEDLNPVVGKVGDFVLREIDLDRLLSYQSADAQQRLEAAPEQRADLVKQILISKAVAAKARKEGFERKPEVKEQLSYLIDNFIAQEYLRKVVIGQVTVSEEELKSYYKKHEAEFVLPEAVKARQIFIEAPSDAGAEARGKAREKAEGILKQLKKGGDFETLAKEHSEDREAAAKGGDVGFISEGKTNSPEFEKAVLALKGGEISNIIETPFGLHIAKVDERREKRVVPFDEAGDYIRKMLQGQLQQKRVTEFVEKLAKESGLQVTGEKAAPPAEPDAGRAK